MTVAWLVLALLPSESFGFLTPPTTTTRTKLWATNGEIMKCLQREYVSFFNPLEPEYYESSVTFEDPLSTLGGIGAYRNNVDLLAGRTPLGKLLFKDASIALHDVRETGENRLRTRWTLRVTFEILPWKPVARFTGISDYELKDGRVTKQIDYWDSIDLKDGE